VGLAADAILGVNFFSATAPQSFLKFDRAFVCMFRVAAGETWVDELSIVNEGGDLNLSFAVFLFSFVLVVNWTLLQASVMFGLSIQSFGVQDGLLPRNSLARALSKIEVSRRPLTAEFDQDSPVVFPLVLFRMRIRMRESTEGNAAESNVKILYLVTPFPRGKSCTLHSHSIFTVCTPSPGDDHPPLRLTREAPTASTAGASLKTDSVRRYLWQCFWTAS
jgi:hypothetical protein